MFAHVKAISKEICKEKDIFLAEMLSKHFYSRVKLA